MSKKGINPLAAGAIGAAVGVAAGVAAVELADEKNREALKEKLGEIKEGGEHVYNEIRETASEVKEKIEGEGDNVKGDD